MQSINVLRYQLFRLLSANRTKNLILVPQKFIHQQTSFQEWLQKLHSFNGESPNVSDVRRAAFKMIRQFGMLSMFDDAILFMNFLDKNYPSVSGHVNVIAPYLKLCSDVADVDVNRKSKATEEIAKWSSRLSLIGPFDLQTASDLVTATSLLPDWKEKCHLILSSFSAGSQAYDSGQLARIKLPLIASSIRDNSAEDFKSIIQHIFTVASKSLSLVECSNVVSNAVLNASKSFKDRNPVHSTMMDLLITELEYLSSKEQSSGCLLLKQKSADAFARGLQLVMPGDWARPKDTMISAVTGSCRQCGENLPSLIISEDLFLKLKKSFFECAFSFKINERQFLKDYKGSVSTFLRSNPNEMLSFRKFLEKQAPFDLIIDGLNVSHRRGPLPQNQRGKVVLNIAKYFASTKKYKILIVARKHVEKTWSSDVLVGLRKLNPAVNIFLTDNLSDDDSFLITAALFSGPQCNILSHDDFRQPAAFFPNETDSALRACFRRWLAARHLLFLWWDDVQKKPVFRGPRHYIVGVSRTKKELGDGNFVESIHVPYQVDDEISQPMPTDKSGVDFRLAAISMLCLKRRHHIEIDGNSVTSF